MGTTEIILLVIGGLFFAVSFFLPDGKKKKDERITEEEIRSLINKEMENAKVRIEDMVDETVNYSVEKTERALEKLSNEKIMAVDEYSETVLKKINDNHNEAVFLYDMLNDKDEKLKNAGEEIKEAKAELQKKEQDLKAELEKKEQDLKAEIEKKEQDLKEAETLLDKQKEEMASVFTPLKVEKFDLVNDVVIPEPAPVTVKAEKSVKAEKTEKKTGASKAKVKKEVPVHFDSDNDGMKNSNEQIRKLHEAGKSNMQIAKELGLGVGEVKLVIDLYANRK